MKSDRSNKEESMADTTRKLIGRLERQIKRTNLTQQKRRDRVKALRAKLK